MKQGNIIGKRIRLVRELRRWTQQQFARKLRAAGHDVSRDIVARWELGARQPEIQMRLPVRLGFGGEQRRGFRALAGVQAFLLAGFIVMDVINPAIAAVETESLLHIFYEAA